MHKIKMILEEIFPFYFLVMILTIMFNYDASRLELCIVYVYAFGASLFNNKVFRDYEFYKKRNKYIVKWGKQVIIDAQNIEKENEYLMNELDKERCFDGKMDEDKGEKRE